MPDTLAPLLAGTAEGSFGASALVAQACAPDEAAAAKAAPSRGKKKAPKTVVGGFVASMVGLRKVLGASQCSFVRCIKPNKTMTPGAVERSMVAEQLRSLGVIQTCQVLKVGLPTRIRYADLSAALAPALPAELLTLLEQADDLGDDDDDADADADDDDAGAADGGEEKAAARRASQADAAATALTERQRRLVACVFFAFDVPPEAFELGYTRAFFRPGRVDVLNDILRFDRSDAAKASALISRCGRSRARPHGWWRRAVFRYVATGLPCGWWCRLVCSFRFVPADLYTPPCG